MKFLLPVLMMSLAVPALAETWKIESTHTEVGFEIPYLGISSVEGRFKTVSGEVVLNDKDITKSKVSVTIDPASIDTANTKRDGHLRSPDFFNVKTYDSLTFKSTKFKKGKGDRVLIEGDLTMHGVTKPVTLTMRKLSKPITNPAGKRVRGAKISAELDRRDFGLTWNKGVKSAGNAIVGDDVEIDIRLVLIER